MQIEIREIHAAGKNGPLNEEWFVLENVGETTRSPISWFSVVGMPVPS